MGHISDFNQRRLARMDASPFSRVYEGIAFSCLARMYEPGRCPSPSGEGSIQRSIHLVLARSLRTVPGACVVMFPEVRLSTALQEDLVRAIDYAITSPTAPPELIHRLLNLCEFMEHEDQRLPIENSILGEYALKYNAYAKALFYKELEFFTEKSPSNIEALVGINTKLQQSDAAWGTLLVAREQYDITKHDQWYERLGRWQDALRTYERKEQEDPGNRDIAIGRMKCLHALGEWDQLAGHVKEYWVSATPEERREIAPMAAASAWSLNDYDSMDNYTATMKAESTDRAFYRAILSVHQNQFPKALAHITKARDLLDPELTGAIGEIYGRSYK